jgi:uroporphyrinogen decarboxylase
MAMAEQLAVVDEDVSARLQTDVQLILPGTSSEFQYTFGDEGRYEAYFDEWGIGWRKPKDGGFYYDMYHHPLSGVDSLDEMKRHPFPNPHDDQRFATLREQAEAAVSTGKAVVLCRDRRGLFLATGIRGLLHRPGPEPPSGRLHA